MDVSLGERIRNKRLEMGMTQVQLASRLGINRGVMSKYESGTRAPTFDKLVALAEILHVSTDFLLGAKPYTTPSLIIDIRDLSDKQANSLARIIHLVKSEYTDMNNERDKDC